MKRNTEYTYINTHAHIYTHRCVCAARRTRIHKTPASFPRWTGVAVLVCSCCCCYCCVPVWLALMCGWVNIFKVYHIDRNIKRARHEMANNKYSALACFLADSFATATLCTLFFPTIAIAYFMMALPGIAYPFLILNFWVVSLELDVLSSLYWRPT